MTPQKNIGNLQETLCEIAEKKDLNMNTGKEVSETQQSIFEKVDTILLDSMIDWFENEGEQVIAFCKEQNEKRTEEEQQHNWHSGKEHENPDARFSAGLDFFLQKGRKEEACRILEKYEEILSDEEVQTSVRQFLKYEDFVDEGIAYMKQYIKRFVDKPGGGAYLMRDDAEDLPTDKQAEFQEIAELAIQNAGEFNDTGLQTMISTDGNNILDYEKLADEYLEELIDKTRYGWGGLGVIKKLLQTGKVEKALEAFEKALRSKNEEKMKITGLGLADPRDRTMRPTTFSEELYEKVVQGKSEDNQVLLQMILEENNISFIGPQGQPIF